MFGPDVAIWRARLDLPVAAGDQGLAPLAVAVRSPAPVPVRLAAWPGPGFAAPEVREVAIAPAPPPAGVHSLPWPPLRAAVRLPALPPLIAPPRQVPPLAVPRVRSDLAAALATPVRRRMVPAGRLAPDTAAHWLRKLADARKMAKTRLELLGIFKDVQLAEGGEVRHQAAQDTCTFPLSPIPVPPSTIVLARRTDSGELVVGRFY